MQANYVNTHNSVNTEGNNVVYFTANNQEAMTRDARGQPTLGSVSQSPMAQQNHLATAEQQMADHIIPSVQTLRQ